jgi:hypothetical protein
VGAGAGAAVDGVGAGALGATAVAVVVERVLDCLLDWELDGELDWEPEPHAAAPTSNSAHASVSPRRCAPVGPGRAGVLSMPKPSAGTVRAL